MDVINLNQGFTTHSQINSARKFLSKNNINYSTMKDKGIPSFMKKIFKIESIEGSYIKAMVFGISRSPVQMWELDHKQSWAPKNWCFQTVVLEKTLENLLDCKEIQPVHPKVNQSWIFIGRIDAEAETPILWPLNVKSRLIGKDPDAGNYWRQEVKGVTEDEMVGWHHQLNGCESEQTLGDSEGHGSLACCSPWGCKVLNTIEWQNNNNNNNYSYRNLWPNDFPLAQAHWCKIKMEKIMRRI